MLDHTSGLFEYQEDKTFVRAVIARPGRAWSPRELVAIAASHGSLFPPGSGFSYANTNYIVLGLVVGRDRNAARSTTPAAPLRPLGLDKTSFPAGTGLPAPMPTANRLRHLTRLNALYDATRWRRLVAWSAGGLVSNADDVTTSTRRSSAAVSSLRASSPPWRRHRHRRRTAWDCSWCKPLRSRVRARGDATGYRSVVYANRRGTRVAVVMVNVDTTYVAPSRLEAAAETAFCSR